MVAYLCQSLRGLSHPCQPCSLALAGLAHIELHHPFLWGHLSLRCRSLVHSHYPLSLWRCTRAQSSPWSASLWSPWILMHHPAHVGQIA